MVITESISCQLPTNGEDENCDRMDKENHMIIKEKEKEKEKEKKAQTKDHTILYILHTPSQCQCVFFLFVG